MERAKTEHQSLLAKYQQQLREIEGTLSQLHESKKALDLMEEQCNALQVETERLAGMTHPIRRYPSDLLQYIFEFVYDQKGSDGLQTALDLSHVCQRWRAIALDSPRLWSTIDYKMKKRDSDISSFWSAIIPRMKAVPPSLVIRDVEAKTIDRLKHLNLGAVPVIKKLEIALANPDNFGLLHALSDAIPEAAIQSLEVKWTDKQTPPNQERGVTWDLGAVLKDDPLSSKLTLKAACTFRLTPSIHFGSVTSLILFKLKEVNIPLILSLFGRLNTLHLEDIVSCPTDGEPRTSLSLECLIFCTGSRNNGRAWLAEVLCPKLNSLHCDASDFPNEWVSFVERHQSLDTLDYTSGENIVPRLASVASQLQHLDINAEEIDEFIDWEAAGLPGPPFPTLKTLAISLTDKLQEKQFEATVRTRCLPRHHSGCKVPPDLVPLGSLTISDPDEDDITKITGLWRTNELFKEAQKTATFDAIWETKGIKLLWM